jgi:CRISPR/Cas system CMR subunit Cmr4 (Cas7 group RAMP superfamily)
VIDGSKLRIHPSVLAMLDEIAPGVVGYTTETEEALYIPLIYSLEEGQGHVGRFLDALPRDRTVRVPTVLSSRLAGALSRRGFRPVREWDDRAKEWIEVWERLAEEGGSER